MYPKVKVRPQKEEDDQHVPLDFTAPVTDQDFSPTTVARIPKYYVSTNPPNLSVAAGVKKDSETEEMSRQNIRAGSVPPPRAVLSSPENDSVIGNKNRIKGQRPSTLKNHKLVENRSAQCIPRHITENSIKAKNSKGALEENGLRERKGSTLKSPSPLRPPKTGKSSSVKK